MLDRCELVGMDATSGDFSNSLHPYQCKQKIIKWFLMILLFSRGINFFAQNGQKIHPILGGFQKARSFRDFWKGGVRFAETLLAIIRALRHEKEQLYKKFFIFFGLH